ncbi:MAG: pentapeptide repeat-containing protein, partial [Alphaproteobacteria bacterium]
SAQFSGVAWFGSAQFSGDAWFGSAQFSGDAGFFMAKFANFATFDKAYFQRVANFGAIRGERGFSLADATFELVPNFIQAHFEEAPRLDNIRVRARMIDPPPAKITRWQRLRSYPTRALVGAWRRIFAADSDAPARFRALKRLAIQGHDADREHEFFGREICAARFVTDWPVHWKLWERGIWGGIWRFWFGWLYEVFGGLGNSILRPFLWWLLLMAVAYVALLGEQVDVKAERAKLIEGGASTQSAYATSTWNAWDKSQSCYAPKGGNGAVNRLGGLVPEVAASTNAPAEALQLAIRNAFIVLDSGGDSSHRAYGCLYGVELYGGNTPVAYVPREVANIAAVQKLISAVLIFLFGLALRNMLKMK